MDRGRLPVVAVAVTGLLRDPAFHVAKCAAEALKLKFPSKFADPVICPLLEFAWHEYLQEKKKELRGEVWAYASRVMCFVDGRLLGDEKELLRWALRQWDYRDFKPEALYQAISEDFYTKRLKNSQHMFVYLDIAIDEQPVGTLLFELFSDACPKTCENFRALCVGGVKSPCSGRELTYKNSCFHRLVKNGWIQGGGALPNSLNKSGSQQKWDGMICMGYSPRRHNQTQWKSQSLQDKLLINTQEKWKASFLAISLSK